MFWLENYKDNAIELGLDRTLKIAKRLSLDTPICPVITVAGTNGKGSTVAVLEAIAIAANLQVGSYTSPHMFSFIERIKINGDLVSEQECINAFQAIKENMANDDNLTYFEFATLVALKIFQSYPLDLMILEVGLGGRLDAVNIVNNQVSIITSISLEHCQYLGNTIEEIACEKAGIIKNNSTVICGASDGRKTINDIAKLCNANIKNIGEDFCIESFPQHWTYSSKRQTIKNLPITSFPIQNAACAITAIDSLLLNISEFHIRQAFVNLKLLGRFQVYMGTCEIIFDVAHNPGAAIWLSEKLSSKPVTGKTQVIIGICTDKDWQGIIKPFLDLVSCWYTIGIENSRLLTADLLAENIRMLTTTPVVSCKTMIDAIKYALDKSEPIDRLVIFGSFFTVALALKIIYGKNIG